MSYTTFLRRTQPGDNYNLLLASGVRFIIADSLLIALELFISSKQYVIISGDK